MTTRAVWTREETVPDAGAYASAPTLPAAPVSKP